MTHTDHHHWFVLAELMLVRSIMIAVGFALIVLGLGLGVTMVMLPVGIAVGFTGVGLFAWGVVGDLPMEH